MPWSRSRATVALLLAALALPTLDAAAASPATSGAPAATPAATTPAKADLPSVAPDDFYVLDPVPPGPPGELLRSQELYAPDGYRLWAILYRSTGLQGEPIAVSGLAVAQDPATVLDGPVGARRQVTAPDGTHPVLSIAHGTTGLADSCAPSRDPIKRLELVAAGFPAADDGWVVVATDYPGLGTPGPHPYIVGLSEGRAVLDAARAAQQLPDLHASDRVALQGISQGGHATLWAAQLAPTEAPELDVVGAVAAAPAGDLRAIADWARSGSETKDSWQNTIAVATAWSEVYGLPLDHLLTPAGMEASARLATECRAKPQEQPLQIDEAIQPEWERLLDENSPGAVGAPMPILYLQGTADEQIPLETAHATLKRLCAVHDTVEYRELPGVDHAGSLYGDDRVTEARAWLADRLAGLPTTATCPAA
ncbi:MAG: lipase family protein [Chloroflexota bacterium]